uniref:G_PROTEIN_RECEP_F1_2 domain-containing protein n=1 Tax=Caenorhabditis tropicalis TaxID=1561998 RepID=A0A1I7V2L4_9PELO
MCSNTFISEFAPNVFQLLPACFAYTGASAISLFVYRMEAVIVHRLEQSLIRRVVRYVKYVFYVNIVFVILLTIFIYPDLKHQKEYKQKMEVRFGTFKPYMWCDNCFFCNFDSNIFRIFFYVAGCAVVLGGTTGGIAFHVTVKALSAVSSRLTAKTRAAHKNYLMSLSLAAGVHVVCIVLPLLGFLSAINVLISLSQFRYFPFILALVIQEHGAASTVIMFLTNNLLRKALKKMLFCDEIIPTVENSSQHRRSTLAVPD